ncbi:hypothetical protein GWO43_00270 [candidate division KSB1 bacterium]|nr:hypothetical protein [candidate division KSB1 bacterium]NIR68504.1 hypothetical protein [candidate division KSB1 bacterium]NIS22518.1 hypothetical protein [candidate division KSB1 bacterium]NIT69362.1 hypothetical protein [candidate division KSB1 bacterium]NIU23023.1 hypothetical protein [candidate division KSB1 bacterium]
MPSKDIPRHEWVKFCNWFKRQHHGWLTSIRVLEEQDSKKVVAEDLALQDIEVRIKDSKEDELKIILGRKPDRGVVHKIKEPSYVWLEKTTEGAHSGLQIKDSRGTTTQLRFRTSVLPEQVDGIVMKDRQEGES